MKNQFLITVLALALLACTNTGENIVSMDAKSLQVKSH